MSDDVLTAIFLEPFPPDVIDYRDGAGGKQFAYVHAEEVIRRLLSSTDYGFEVIKVSLVPAADKTAAYWLCHGRMTIPGMSPKDGIGTALALNEDSVKGAMTDCLKICAKHFGIALHLYHKVPNNAIPRSSSNGADTTMPRNDTRMPVGGRLPINEGAEPCSSCYAPTGRPHATSCKR